MDQKIVVWIHVLVVCAVLGVLGLITVILGVAGQASMAQPLVHNVRSCENNRTIPAVGCGVVAALLALTGQIIASDASGCCGCGRPWRMPAEPKRIAAAVLSAVSWILVIIVVVLFMVGVVLNKVEDAQLTVDRKCFVAGGAGEFAAATILSLVAVICQINSHILLHMAVAGSVKPLAQQHSGVTMRRPEAANGGDHTPTAPTKPNGQLHV